MVIYKRMPRITATGINLYKKAAEGVTSGQIPSTKIFSFKKSGI